MPFGRDEGTHWLLSPRHILTIAIINTMQAHFRGQGTKTDAQKQRQMEELRSKVSGEAPNLQQMLAAATDFVMVGDS